jgi:hypothetical protein
MTDDTRLLENPVEATEIVKKFALLLVKHVLELLSHDVISLECERKQ